MNLFDKNLLEDFSDSTNDSIIFFHGYGADAQDLFPLSDAIPTTKKYNWYFPNGPLSVPIGMGWEGRAWWQISVERYQQESSKLDISEEVPAGIDKLVTEFKLWLEAKKIDPKKLILGGFSQGGMLALNLFFNLETPPKALVLLSSNLVNKSALKNKIKPEMKDSTYIISHGHNDSVLPIAGADRMQSFLNSAGLKGKMIRFNGVHEIPQQIISEVGSFISQ